MKASAVGINNGGSSPHALVGLVMFGDVYSKKVCRIDRGYGEDAQTLENNDFQEG